MINYNYKSYFTREGYPKTVTIQYTPVGSSYKRLLNADLEADSFVLDDPLCTADQLEFGTCLASSVEFNVGSNVTDLEIGMQLRITIIVNQSAPSTTPIYFGYFYITSIELSGDKVWRKVKAYDQMATILNAEMADWYNGLFPNTGDTITIKNMRDSFFNYLGITQDTATLINDNVSVGKTINSASISGKQIIEAICQMNGVFGKISRYNKFKYVSLDDTVRTEVGTNGTYLSAECESYVTAAIDKVQIRTNENDIGAIVGSGTNALIIENNFLLFGKDSTELTTIGTAILNKVSGITLRPFKAKLLGLPYMEVGDAIRITTANQTIDSYILRRKLTGIQCLFDEMEAKSTQAREEQLNTTNHSMLLLAYKSNELTRTVEETQSTITQILDPTDPTSLQSQITQNAQAITLKVSKGEVISSINQSAEAVTIDANKINLNGAVTANNNVTIDTNGVITAVGATLSNCTVSSYESKALYSHPGEVDIEEGRITLYDRLAKSNGIYESRILVLDTSYSDGTGIKFYTPYANPQTDPAAWIFSNSHDLQLRIDSTTELINLMPGNLEMLQCKYNTGYLNYTWYGYVLQPSDERLKKDVKALSDLVISAIGKVELKQFVFDRPNKKMNTGKVVFGAVAQEVIKQLEASGLDVKTLDIISEFEDPTNHVTYYGLNYDEFLIARIAYLEKKVESLEERIAKLEQIILKGADND